MGTCGQDDCCCGGCGAPPHDGSSSTAAIKRVQQLCCSCIPKRVCVNIGPTGIEGTGTGTTSDDSVYALIEKVCPDYDPDTPIQYQGLIRFRGEHTIIIRLEVDELGQCYLTWSIADLSLSGSKLIDHTDLIEDNCQKTRDCVEFGGDWEIEHGVTLTISRPASLDILSNIECGGCKCMCSCLCISVASRNVGSGSFTITGTNQIVCHEMKEVVFSNCDLSQQESVKYAEWSYDGWSFQLSGDSDSPFTSYTVNHGLDTPLPCGLTSVLRFSDEEVHRVRQLSNQLEVVYEYESVLEKTPQWFRWIGQVITESALLNISVYNFVTSSWDEVAVVNGHPLGTTIAYSLKRDIKEEHIEVTTVNRVLVRFVGVGALFMETDMLRMHTTSCCAISLSPKTGVVPVADLSPVLLSSPTTCPSVYHSWNFIDEDDVEWYIAIECSWCDGGCGTVFTGCCGRPIPRILYAELEIGCEGCPGIVSVLLIADGSGAIWEGSAAYCGQTVSVQIACSGSEWAIVVEMGACIYTDSVLALSCEPLYIVAEGELSGGLGCCTGLIEQPTVPIRLEAFE